MIEAINFSNENNSVKTLNFRASIVSESIIEIESKKSSALKRIF